MPTSLIMSEAWLYETLSDNTSSSLFDVPGLGAVISARCKILKMVQRPLASTELRALTSL